MIEDILRHVDAYLGAQLLNGPVRFTLAAPAISRIVKPPSQTNMVLDQRQDGDTRMLAVQRKRMMWWPIGALDRRLCA